MAQLIGEWPADFEFEQSKYISTFLPDYNNQILTLVSLWAGPDDPVATYPCQLWADTTSGWLKIRNTSDTAWNKVQKLNTDTGGVLALTGGTMEGALNMGGYGITNLPAGSGTAPARYSDLASYMKIDGSVDFTGLPELPAIDPTAANHPTRKSYVDAKALAGGTYTGQINMTVAPSVANHVMRQTDVDSAISGHGHEGGSDGAIIEADAGLASTGEAEGQYLHSDGANGVVWDDPPGGHMRTQPATLWTLTTDTGWLTQDVSTYMDKAETIQTRRGSILALEFSGGTAASYIALDLRIATGYNEQIYTKRSTDTGGIPEVYTLIAIVPITTDKKFDYRARQTGTAQSVTGKFLGYI